MDTTGTGAPARCATGGVGGGGGGRERCGVGCGLWSKQCKKYEPTRQSAVQKEKGKSGRTISGVGTGEKLRCGKNPR